MFFCSVRLFFAALPKIFANKKGCNLVSVKILYCNRAYFFAKRLFAFPRSSARRYFVCNKVPWLCVTASRRFCRKIFSYFKGKFTSDLRNIPLLPLRLYITKKPLSSVFLAFLTFLIIFKIRIFGAFRKLSEREIRNYAGHRQSGTVKKTAKKKDYKYYGKR